MRMASSMVEDEDLAVPDLAGLGGLDDGGHGGIFLAVRDDDFEFDFGQEIHGSIRCRGRFPCGLFGGRIL